MLHGTIINVYLQTMTQRDKVKDKFYDDLDRQVYNFNARVDIDQTCEGVIDSENVGKCNSNGLLLIGNVLI